jgi:lysophospholipase L1-like esterase
MRYLAPRVPDLDAVLLLVGVNDLTLRLAQDESYDPAYLERPGAEEHHLRRTFSVLPASVNDSLPFFKRTALWRAARAFKHALAAGESAQDRAGLVYETWRKHRRRASRIRPGLPDLDPALEEYARNLESIVALARERTVRLILVTQPVLWRPELPEEARNLLWLGGVGDFQNDEGCEYYSVEALAEGMRRYNAVLLEIARIHGVEVVDLAAAVGGDPALFYDDAHFNAAGARVVAETIAAHLIANPPCAEGSTAGE